MTALAAAHGGATINQQQIMGLNFPAYQLANRNQIIKRHPEPGAEILERFRTTAAKIAQSRDFDRIGFCMAADIELQLAR